ncbi:hypothetical protein GCM10020001_113590 [Nonomuraea salmonea]
MEVEFEPAREAAAWVQAPPQPPPQGEAVAAARVAQPIQGDGEKKTAAMRTAATVVTGQEMRVGAGWIIIGPWQRLG